MFAPEISAVSNFFENWNPIDSIEWPALKLRNPYVGSHMTDHGGQAFFRKNAPRSLINVIPKKILDPHDVNSRNFFQTEVAALGLDMNKEDDNLFIENVVIGPYSEIGKNKPPANITSYYPNSSMNEKGTGDVMTNAPIAIGDTLSEAKIGKKLAYQNSQIQGGNFVEHTENGMPFYFKDLRSNQYIIFRAYIDSLTEQLSPEWTSDTYIGRSEPVYVYQKADRSVSFNLKLFAQTGIELNNIYELLDSIISDEFLKVTQQTKNTFLASHINTV